VTDLDLDRAAASQLDALIERWTHEAKAREQEGRSVGCERTYNHARAAEHRQAWCEYHRHRSALFEDLPQEHRETLGWLIDGKI